MCFRPQDVTFTFTATGASTFTLRIEGAPDATGDWATATHINALGFKDLGIDFQAPGVTATMTSPSDWNYVQGELDANACKDPSGQKAVICFEEASPLALANDMLFSFTINGGAVLDLDDAGPHLKLNFSDASGNKIGDILSLNMPLSTSSSTGSTGGSGNRVPEPGTLGLLGLGLLGIGYGRRLRKSK